jgi:hypothetical protein
MGGMGGRGKGVMEGGRDEGKEVGVSEWSVPS